MGLSRSLWVTGIGLLVLSLALPVSWYAWPARTPAMSMNIDRQAWEVLTRLQDQHGRPAADSLTGDRWTLVFFGFTHCADICPATLGQLNQAMQQLGGEAARLQPVFVTLDPERDTPEHLARYLEFFDERLLGLTGTPEQIEQVAEAWGIYSRRVPTGDSYMLDHSTTLFLLTPDGELSRRLSGQAPGRSLAEDIAAGVSG